MRSLSGIVYWEPESSSILNQSGNWKCWAHVVYTDGTEADSNIFEFYVYEVGT